VCEIGQDHRPSGQDRGLPDDLIGRGARHGKLGEHLVQALRCAQVFQLGVDDPGVHRLGDLDERDLALEGDQRQPATGGGPYQRIRQGSDVPSAQLNRQGAHSGPSEVSSVASQQHRLGRQRDPGGEHEFAALQQVGRVGQLEHMDPADPRAETGAARDHLRAAPAHDVEAEQVANRGKHVQMVKPDRKSLT
jgi:hypothetical protein